MRVYIKTEKYGNEVCMYDEEKLTYTRVYQCKEVEYRDDFNDLEDIRDSIKRDFNQGYYIISSKEFYDNLNKFKTELEIITKKE